MDMILKHAGLLLRKANPAIPERQTGTNKVAAAWFVDPGRTALEILFCLVWFVVVAWRGELMPDWTYDAKAQRHDLDATDWVSGIALLLHIPILFYYKWTKGRMWFLLQPCNAWVLILAYVHFSRSALSVWLFNWYLHIQWGSWVGCLAADLRDYHYWHEKVFFFTLHIVIVGMPLYHIMKGTFVVYPADIWRCGTLFVHYHYLMCLPLSIYSSFNLNYMMWPPKELVKCGSVYRPLMCSAGYLLNVISRFGLLPIFYAITSVVGR